MKTLLISALIIFFAGSCFPQQITRRTLIEEFTSSSSDQAATSDPIINQLEGEAPGRFCIIKWYTPWGTKGGTNSFYNNYTLATTRSQGYYNNDTVVRLFLNGGAEVDPYRMPLDSLRSKVANEYKKTSPFIMDITQEIIGDSLIAKVTVRSVDTSYDLSPLSIGLVMIERFNQTSDINHSPYHTNIVRGVLHSLDAKNGAFRDALPFAYEMQGQKVHTFRFAGKIGTSWDRYGLASVAIIQNNLTKEVLQCNWTVPELQFLRPTGNTFPLLRGTTPCQFQLRNMTDSDFTVYPQLAQTSPAEWNLKLSGMDYPNFVLKAHSAATGTFVSESQIPLRGSGNFSLLLFTQPGIVVASIAGTIVGSDSRDLIIKNWTSSVYPSDPDIMKWKEFGLDAAIVNEDAIGDLYANDLRRFRTLYIQRANYGDSAELESIKAFIDRGGRMIFQSNKVLDYYSKSIVDTSVNKYAVKFKNIFHSIPTGVGAQLWSKGNVVKGNVFTDSLSTPFVISQKFEQPLVPIDTFSKLMIVDQYGTTVGTAVESGIGKIVYLTFPLGDIQNNNTLSFMTGKILDWFKKPVSKVSIATSNDVSAIVYPNPVTATAMIKTSIFENSTLTVHDALGRIVHVPIERISGGEISIDCSHLLSGTYYYFVLTAGRSIQGKIVVAR